MTQISLGELRGFSRPIYMPVFIRKSPIRNSFDVRKFRNRNLFEIQKLQIRNLQISNESNYRSKNLTLL